MASRRSHTVTDTLPEFEGRYSMHQLASQ